MILQISDAALVAHASIEIDSIRDGHAVLRDYELRQFPFCLIAGSPGSASWRVCAERWLVIVFPNSGYEVVDTLGIDFPHGRVLTFRRLDLRRGHNGNPDIMFYDRTRVIVDSQ